jgi:hypothetical protein
MAIDYTTDLGKVRLLIPDTDETNLVLADAQITALLAMEIYVKRAAAAAIDLIASNEVMVSKVIKTQDLATDGAKVSVELRARATELRRQVDEDDDATSGNIDIIDFRDPFTRPWRDHELTEPESWWW